ncbi:MAG: diacylglycerol/lipid kinase family protein, partial [Deltaproteobacteria bacterium]
MRYSIITNPASGNFSLSRRRKMLDRAARILQAEVFGLDTTSREEFLGCARELARACDVLVVAGGDGSLSDVINAIAPKERPIAYIPLGSGNAMGHALRLRGSVEETATRIKDAPIREFDLIRCDEDRLAYMVSVGLEGAVIKKRDEYKARGTSGIKAYLMALVSAYFRGFKTSRATVFVDGKAWVTEELLSLIITKQPYYGYGVKVMPGARLDDRQLHIRLFRKGVVSSLVGGFTSLTVGNR